MVLKKRYKTLAGAQRRAASENAHSKTHRYIIRSYNVTGKPLLAIHPKEFDALCHEGGYWWQIEKVKK